MFGHNFHLLCFLDCEPAYRMTRRDDVPPIFLDVPLNHGVEPEKKLVLPI